MLVGPSTILYCAKSPINAIRSTDAKVGRLLSPRVERKVSCSPHFNRFSAVDTVDPLYCRQISASILVSGFVDIAYVGISSCWGPTKFRKSMQATVSLLSARRLHRKSLTAGKVAYSRGILYMSGRHKS